MDTLLWVIIVAVVAIVAVALTAAYLSMRQRNRSSQLRERFGPEYDRAMSEHGNRGKAESALMDRQRRVERLRLRELSQEERSRFGASWKSVQERFVDDPPAAVSDAQDLVDEAMKARGFPMADFDQKAADISVEHPYVVENYHAARAIAEASDRGDADTEELRQGMVHYRSLFTELINKGGQPAMESQHDGDRRGPQRDRTPEPQRERRPSFRKREPRPR
jgi:hypothetical protein